MRGVIMVEFVSRLGVPDDIISKIYHALNGCLVPLLLGSFDMNPVNLDKEFVSRILITRYDYETVQKCH